MGDPGITLSDIYREADHEAIASSIRKNSTNIIVLYGDAGSGKTFIGERAIQKDFDRAYVYKYKFSSHISLCILIERLILDLVFNLELLSNMDPKTVTRRLSYFLDLDSQEANTLVDIINEKSSNYNMSILCPLFEKILEKTHGRKIIFLDDIHWVNDQISEFFRKLTLPPGTSFILTSRIRPELDKPNVYYHHVLPLTEEDAKNIIIRNLPHLTKKKAIILLIIEKCKGNTFFLNTLLGLLKLHKHKDNNQLKKFIRLSKLSNDFLYGLVKTNDNQKNILSALSLEAFLNHEILLSILKKNSLKKDLNYLTRAGLLIENHSGFSLPHDIFGEQLRSEMPLGSRRRLHLRIAKSFMSQNLGKISVLEKISFHFHAANEWRLAYKYSSSAANFYLKHHRPNEALVFFTRAENSCRNLNLLTPKRKITFSIQRAKASFLLGISGTVISDVKNLEDAYLHLKISNKVQNEIINLLSLFYWNSGKLSAGYELLRDFEVTGSAENQNIALFKFRQVGILSDMGEFYLSNSIAKKFLEKNNIEGIHKILGIPYSIKSAILSIMSRNYAYLKDQKNSDLYKIEAMKSYPDDNTLPSIFCLCFLADASMALGKDCVAKEFCVMAVEKARKYNLTALNSFLFSLLGYLEVMEGNNLSISKIERAIKAAESEERLGRLPHYYLLLIKAKRFINPNSPLKNLIKRATKIAKKNNENWVASALQGVLS